MPVHRRQHGWLRTSLALVCATALVTGLMATLPTAVAAASIPLAPSATTAPAATEAAGPSSHTITYDSGSLKIDGRRLMIFSGEFAYWRLPSTSLWLDMLQKMKANGYNAVSIYFDWAYHSPKSGVYDFAGVRDVDLLLDMAQQVGLYVIARPGPYINAETDAGGFPSWLINVAGKGRTDAPDYLAAVDQWMTQIDTILARHQLTNGTGTVILDQIENELSATGTTQKNYMQHLYDKAKADGITVPIFHNDKGRNGIWVPTSSTVSGTVQGPNDLYAFDGYPGGTCSTNASVGSPSTAPDWGLWGAGGASGGASASPNTPGFVAEFGGGWFDYWGSQGTYDCTAQREGPGYERVFYETNVANGLSIQNFYMTFGGTSWGWLPAPVVYTSYDYGAAFSESRQIRAKATTMKELGLFLQSVDVPTDLIKSDVITPSSTAVKVYNDVNAETGAHLYVAMHNPSSATTNDTFTFPITTPDGSYTIPQTGALRLNGQDSKMLVSNYAMDGQHLVYSTSEIMTHFSRSDGDTALLYGRNGETGETVLRYTSQPTVQVLAGTVSPTWDTTKGDLRLDYTHTGLAQVRISGGGRPALTLLLADQDTADSFWRQDTAAGPVLERGPELVRTATVDGSTLTLTGDTSYASDLQVWAPSGVTAMTWNGATVPVTTGPSGDLSATRKLSAPPAVTLPDLTQATWSYAPGSPESDPSFDDAGWTAADHTTTTSTTPPPTGAPVLTEDDYGFHQGDVWYRGSYTGTAAATTLSLNYGAGGAGMLQVWLDGIYLGQNVLPSGVSAPPTTGTAKFTIPDSLRTGNHLLAVMVRNDGHNEDGGVNDAYKEGRGLISVTTAGAGGTVTTPISWKIQGTLNGEDTPDTARGSNNVGGSYGERNGWYLPGFPDSSWITTTVPAATAMPGTSWYRTTFSLDEPTGIDASLGLTIGNPAVPQSTGNYRALIYLNGWNIGQYIANVGPQHTFVMPNGILNPNGQNTLAISVTSDGGAGNGLESVELTDLGTVAGGVPVTMNTAPDWSAAVYGTSATAGGVSVDSVTSDASDTTKGGDVIHVTARVTNRTTEMIAGATVTLSTPAGWNEMPTGATTVPDLAAGDSRTFSWTVTVPQATTVGNYQVVASATALIGGKNETSGRTLLFPVRNAGDTYISDMPWVSSISGYGTIGRDVSVGGGPLTMNSVVYPKGVGVNSISTVVVALPTGCTTFTSTVGLDVASSGKGSVTFAVIGDGVTLAQTATIAGTAAPIPLTVDITGVKQLTLTVGDGGNGNGHDNADWGNAEIHCTVLAAPRITTISPAVVPVAGGTNVTLTGTGFASDATVSVDGSADITPASISSDGTALTFAAPAHDGGTVPVTVKTSAGTSTAHDLAYLAAPTTTAVSPSHGITDGGTVVTLTGTGYTDDATVSVDGGAPITPTSVNGDINSSTSTLTFTAPAHSAGPVGVVVTTPGGSSDAATYTYDTPGPTVIPVPPAPAWTDTCGVDNNGSFSGYADTAQYSWKVTDHSTSNGKVGIVVTAAEGFAFPAGARVQWTRVQDNSRCDASITATTTAQTCRGAVSVPGSLKLDETGIRVAYVYVGAVTGTKAGDLSKLAPGQYLIIATAADGSAFNTVPAGWKASPTTDADGNTVKVSRVVTVPSTHCTSSS